jgi:hypothetical protein
MQKSNERGIALITTMLVLMLISALLIGFTTVVMSDQRYRFIDGDRVKAFYGASGGMEKLTADLGNLFLANVAPTKAQVTALTDPATQPSISGVTFTATSPPEALPASELTPFYCTSTAAVVGGPPAINRAPVVVGTNGYTISFCANTATTNPTTTAEVSTIKTGPYEGLMALKAPYQIDVTAKTATFGEVHLVRTIEAVAIPVFQFGIFSDVDLGFNAADDFSFGGRVHTNGHLFLSQGDGTTLTLSEKVTAVKEVVRQRLSNGATIDSSNKNGIIKLAKGGGAYVTMDRTWGSVVDGPASAQNEPTWHTTSLSTYKNYIRNGRTGARKLDLPLINLSVGGTNTDLTRRPPATESPASILFNERLFTKASIRVLLSDTAADITNIATIDNSVAPVSLEAGTWGGIPIAASPGAVAGVTVGAVGNGSTVNTIKVAAIPTYYLAPGSVGSPTQLDIASGTDRWKAIGCTSKTATTFVACTISTVGATIATSIPIGATVSALVNGILVSNTTTALLTNVTIAVKTLTLSAVAGSTPTGAFAPQTFWIDDNLATCTGYDTATLNFTTCTTAVAPANGRPITTFAMSPKDTSLIGGFIKIERLNASDSTWHDITAEILGYGIGAPSQVRATNGLNCDAAATDPSPNAILRLQRLHDSGQVNNTTANCTPKAGAGKYDYWPNTLFDGREGWPRDTTPVGTNIKLGGVMHYIAIDAANLSEWFSHTAPYNTAADTGNLSKTDNGGYSIYISDRRNNRDAASKETAEYGWEDFVNPLSATATPNGVLDAGEDLNANTVLDTYGGKYNCNGVYNTLASGGITCADATYTSFYQAALGPMSDMVSAVESAAGLNGIGRAMVNRPLMFRRAIELIHGGSIAPWVTGFTLVTENPVYMRGDWNAVGGNFLGTHAATSVIADSFTALSGNWSDPISFVSPYSAVGRSKRTGDSYYRVAVLAGKGALFPQPAGTGSTFGTDGGAHSFVRYLEDNAAAGADTIHYKGSLATFFYNRQGVGTFKGNQGLVYGIPAVRDFTFDTDFLIPALLPPLTPVFRDMNAVGFSQDLRPGK